MTGKRDIIKEGKQAENVHEEKKCSGRGKFQNWIGGGGVLGYGFDAKI